MNTSSAPNAKSERDRLILEHLNICKSMALRIQRTVPAQVELDDLIHAGVLGLMDAADKYDAAKGVAFASYASHRIRGAILDSLRELDLASRDLRRRCRKMDAVTDDLYKTLHRAPSEEEIAERLNVSVAELRKLRFEAHSVTHVSTCYVSPVDDSLIERDVPAGLETQPDNMLAQLQMQSALDKAMKPLRPRQLQVVAAYYSGNKTMKEIATSMGIVESRVSQLHKSALAKMQTELRASGVHSGGAF
jgi:RNA polymerase sigma factor for flagellar operon FliA